MIPPELEAMLAAAPRESFIALLCKVFQTLNPGQSFVPEWHLQAIGHVLDRVQRGECRRLIINMPPRSLKSITVSVAWVAWLLGHDPKLRIICASYSQDLAQKLQKDFQAIVTAPWFRALFPDTRIGGKDTQDEIELTQRGGRLAVSVGGPLTGRGGNIIIIDDPLKASDALSDARRNAVNEWFTSTVLSRLDDKRTGAIVIVMQRVHMNDLSGFVQQTGEDWTVLSLPAIAETDEEVTLGKGRVHHRVAGSVLSPVREPHYILESLKAQIGGDLFSAQYQQQPVPPGGAMIKRLWVKRYAELPPMHERLRTIQSWDTAMKGGPANDFSVCTTWMQTIDTRWYLLDVWRGRVDYPALKAKVIELAERWAAAQVFVEDVGTATGLLAELGYHVRGLTGVRPDRDKISRLAIVSGQFEAGQVFFPIQESWLPDLEAELFAFPGGVHDDQVDSISQALQHGKNDLAIWATLGMKQAEFLARGGR